MKIKHLIFSNLPTLNFIFLLFFSCQAQTEKKKNSEPNQKFGAYWFKGEAELTTYRLEQARYGEIHEGNAVLIFVTEDLSKSKQVKLDDPNKNQNDAIKVLKLNKIRRFNTGIYDYSMMLSSFVPINQNTYSEAIKITSSSQDWCGQTYSQVNLENNSYSHKLFSYFESEGDSHQRLPKIPLEDQLWQQIRLNPKLLPQGNIKVIPGLEYARLRHAKLTPQEANATLKIDNEVTSYELKYNSISRKLIIKFQTRFPHKIIEWEEEYPSGFGKNKTLLVSRGLLIKTIKTPYWEFNSIKDSVLREPLFNEDN